MYSFASASRRDSHLLAALRASLLTRTSASLIHLLGCNFFASASRRDSQLLAALRASLLTRTSAFGFTYLDVISSRRPRVAIRNCSPPFGPRCSREPRPSDSLTWM